MVLDSQPQNPLGLQGHDVLAIRTACRSLLFSSGLQIVETLVWLIWPLPSPHLKEGSPGQGAMLYAEGSCSLHPMVSPMTIGR